jgi:hypothetical protein
MFFLIFEPIADCFGAKDDFLLNVVAWIWGYVIRIWEEAGSFAHQLFSSVPLLRYTLVVLICSAISGFVYSKFSSYPWVIYYLFVVSSCFVNGPVILFNHRIRFRISLFYLSFLSDCLLSMLPLEILFSKKMCLIMLYCMSTVKFYFILLIDDPDLLLLWSKQSLNRYSYHISM